MRKTPKGTTEVVHLTKVQNFGVSKIKIIITIKAFILQGSMKLIKSDSKDIL